MHPWKNPWHPDRMWGWEQQKWVKEAWNELPGPDSWKMREGLKWLHLKVIKYEYFSKKKILLTLKKKCLPYLWLSYATSRNLPKKETHTHTHKHTPICDNLNTHTHTHAHTPTCDKSLGWDWGGCQRKTTKGWKRFNFYYSLLYLWIFVQLNTYNLYKKLTN